MFRGYFGGILAVFTRIADADCRICTTSPHGQSGARRPLSPPDCRELLPLRVGSPVTRNLTRRGWEKPGQRTNLVLSSSQIHMPTRQERRRTERDAAKRAPTKAGAAGSTGAAAAREDVHVNSLGDWKTQAEDPSVGPTVCLTRHGTGCRLTQETWVQSAVNDVASDVCLARPFGAVSSARRRRRETEGGQGAGAYARPLFSST